VWGRDRDNVLVLNVRADADPEVKL
jgi:hypothetical protein